jgi:hypothetical protein
MPGSRSTFLAILLILMAGPKTVAAEIIDIRAMEGTNLWVSPEGARDWIPASTQLKALKSGDRVRCGANTRLTLQVRNQGVIRIAPDSEIEIRPPPRVGPSLVLGLKRGLLYFFPSRRTGEHRDPFTNRAGGGARD